MTSTLPADRTLRIGTRSSPMALAQVELVTALLRRLDPDLKTEVHPVTTEADLWQGDLAKLGGRCVGRACSETSDDAGRVRALVPGAP